MRIVRTDGSPNEMDFLYIFFTWKRFLVFFSLSGIRGDDELEWVQCRNFFKTAVFLFESSAYYASLSHSRLSNIYEPTHANKYSLRFSKTLLFYTNTSQCLRLISDNVCIGSSVRTCKHSHGSSLYKSSYGYDTSYRMYDLSISS